MARPQKKGLDYFPLDVDIDQDDKIALIEAKHGAIGFAVIIKLLMKIYKNGYFYEWTEKEQLLFSKRVNVNINLINEVVNDCVNWELFDSNLLKSEKILTSKGIQARYLEAARRRAKVEIKKEYLLLNKDKANVYKNFIIVDNNHNNKDIFDNINPQSKVKKSKVKKSKTNDINTTIDSYTDNLELKNTIYDFIEMRKTIKKPMTNKALNLLLSKLDKLANNDDVKIKILEQSIFNNWQGIFELKNSYQKNNSKIPEKDDSYYSL